MASIVRKNLGERELATTPARWDPFQLVREMIQLDPLRALDLAPFGLERAGRGVSFVPAFDMKETRDAFVLEADLPGVREEDVEVSLTGNRLTVSGRREAEHREEGDTHFVYERSHGAFTRTFTVPDGCDTEHIEAELRDGVLRLRVPKRPEVQPRKISLKSLKDRVASKAKA
jgi:HSP20 family protein